MSLMLQKRVNNRWQGVALSPAEVGKLARATICRIVFGFRSLGEGVTGVEQVIEQLLHALDELVIDFKIIV